MKFKEWRFKKWHNTDYIIDRLLFNIALVVVFVYLFFVAYSMNFDFSTNIYYKCDSPNPCENPFYNSGEPDIFNQPMPEKYRKLCVWDWCEEEYLEPGFEFGQKPTAMFKFAGYFSIGVLIFAFILNHFFWNRETIEIQMGRDKQ